MNALELISFLVQVTALAGAIALPLWALIELRGRRIFVTREEFMADRHRADQRLQELIVQPLEKITAELGVMSRATVVAEAERKSITRTLDELRDEIRLLRE